jgi:hypothetical protein
MTASPIIQAVEVDWWEAEAGPWVTKGEKVTAGGRGAGQGGDLDLGGGCGSSRKGHAARGGGEEWLGFQRGVVDAELGFPWGAGWIGSVLFHPFRCVGSAQMYGADGLVPQYGTIRGKAGTEI